MTSSVSIDYLSFSVDLVNKIDDSLLAMRVVADSLRELLGHVIFEGIFLEPDGWEPASGQRPYKYGQANHQIGVFVWFGGHSNALIQFSGNGCKFLERYDWLSDVIAAAKDRLTRLDMAIDIETPVTPSEFVKAGYNGRIRSGGYANSPTGETYWIGSRSSQKYCRVYRYNEPHPRHKLLRIEYETKKAQARIAAEVILDRGLAYATESLTKYYRWEHEVMPEPADMVEKMQSEISTRTDAKTLHWILVQCAPAIRRLVENGTISEPREFFEKHFLPKMIERE